MSGGHTFGRPSYHLGKNRPKALPKGGGGKKKRKINVRLKFLETCRRGKPKESTLTLRRSPMENLRILKGKEPR